jgi:hypothetical protein
MSSKQKIAISAIGIVLVLAVIGLTIGLVLVASQAEARNSMTVSYTASGVACEIGSNAWLNNGSDAAKTAEIKQNGQTVTKITTKANMTTEEASGTITYADVDLANNGNGYITYVYSIKNTTTSEATNNKIKATATVTGLSENDNVNVVVTTTTTAPEASVAPTEDDVVYSTPVVIDSIDKDATAYFVITVSITNADLDITDLAIGMTLVVERA